MGVNMNHSNELLHQVFAVFLFCIAVSALFYQYHNYLAALNSSTEILNDKIMYEQYNNKEENIYTKGEIIAFLLNQLEYDVEIDGLFISKSENLKENISAYSIRDNSFGKSYVYDKDGKISRIIFTSMDD